MESFRPSSTRVQALQNETTRDSSLLASPFRTFHPDIQWHRDGAVFAAGEIGEYLFRAVGKQEGEAIAHPSVAIGETRAGSSPVPAANRTETG